MEEKHRVPKDEVARDRSDDRPLREGDVLGVSDAPPDVEIPRATTDRGGHPAGIEVRERTSGNSELRQTPGATGIDMGAGGTGTDIEPPSRRPAARDTIDE